MGIYIYAITKNTVVADSLRVNQYEYLLKPAGYWEAYFEAWNFGEKIPTHFDEYERRQCRSMRTSLRAVENRYRRLEEAGQVSNLFVEGALPELGQVVRVYNSGQRVIGSTYEDDSVPDQAMEWGYLYKNKDGVHKLWSLSELNNMSDRIWGAPFKTIAESGRMIPVVGRWYLDGELKRQEHILANLFDGMGGTIRNDNNKAIRS